MQSCLRTYGLLSAASYLRNDQSSKVALEPTSPSPYGFLKGTRDAYNEEKFHRFIAAMDVGIIIVDEEVARKYAVIFLDLNKKGTRIPLNDVWIAACCMASGGTLLTRDQHFEKVDQIDKIILSP